MSQRLARCFDALERDLLHEDGPRISTMRNYRFCLLVYPPHEEFEQRELTRALSQKLSDGGWVVKAISLQRLLIDRLQRRGDGYLERLIARERAATARGRSRGLELVRQKLTQEIEGEGGIAADVIREIDTFVRDNPHKADRTLALIGGAGALYPFFRSSALLKHIPGRTQNVPVVLLYPGEFDEERGLRFMGILKADTDYRPRIYK